MISERKSVAYAYELVDALRSLAAHTCPRTIIVGISAKSAYRVAYSTATRIVFVFPTTAFNGGGKARRKTCKTGTVLGVAHALT